MTAKPIRHSVQRRGIAIVYFLVASLLLLGLATFAVDLGYITTVRSELQSSVDAASLAAVSGLPFGPTEVRARAKAIALSNKVNGQGLALQDGDIELGLWNSAANEFTPLTGLNESRATAVRVTGRLSKTRGTQLNLVFAPLLGFKDKELSIGSTAGFALAADVVIVQDITTSFSDELADAKVGDQALLDSLYMDGNGRSLFGLAAHTGWGLTISPLRQINTNYTLLTNAISSLKLAGNPGMPVASGTDPVAGLEEAIKIFNDPDYPSTSPTGKAIVFVSDGEPNVSSSGSHPTLTNAQLLALAQQRADEAWAQKIHIYVVFFNRDNSATAAAQLRSLARGKGDFVQVTDAKQLPVALEAITRKLPMAIVR